MIDVVRAVAVGIVLVSIVAVGLAIHHVAVKVLHWRDRARVADGLERANAERDRLASLDKRLEATEHAKVADLLDADRTMRGTQPEDLGALFDEARAKRAALESEVTPRASYPVITGREDDHG